MPFDQAASYRTAGRPQCDGLSSSRHNVGDDGVTSEHERERAGPEALSEPLGIRRPIAGAGSCVRDAGYVHDERVDGRPSLRGKDPRDRSGLGGDCPQTVDGLGREGDQPSALQDLSRQIERGGIGKRGVDCDHARSRQA